MMTFGIIIDVCVAVSANGVSQNPSDYAVECRKVLKTVRENSYNLVCNDFIKGEWKKHIQGKAVFPLSTEMRKFAKRWYVAMISEGRIVPVAMDTHKNLIDSMCNDVVGNLDEFIKDSPYIDAALATDNRVISNDRKMLRELCHLSNTHKCLCAMAWLDPAIKNVTNWLSIGAPLTPEYCIPACRPPTPSERKGAREMKSNAAECVES